MGLMEKLVTFTTEPPLPLASRRRGAGVPLEGLAAIIQIILDLLVFSILFTISPLVVGAIVEAS